eukprot:TRINITY_DN10485_c0_g1_i1.p1 TRINITY_DN10485_c0_g1~~TRINITY_DN10485_c0_g1_i1.p1  ORF type:complete len:235 (+),score=97.24 TRINITY_DN10485_c0_g1_i1:153-857(+)
MLTITAQQRLLGAASTAIFAQAVCRADATHPVHVLGLLFSFSCAFRAWVWVSVPTRMGLPGHPALLSSAGADRSVATVGECSQAAVVAASMWRWAVDAGVAPASVFDSPAAAVFALLTTAQLWCWLGLLRADCSYHIVEETQWAAAAFVVAATYPPVRVVALAYAAYMIFLDIPMYIALAKHQDPEAVKKTAASPVFDCRVRTADPAAWEGDVTWRWLYFTAASFAISSLALTH